MLTNHTQPNDDESSTGVDESIFIRRLRSRMAYLNMSQSDLAHISGLSHVAIHHYLRGARNPKAGELSRMSHSLGTSMDWLWGADADLPSQSEARTEIIQLKTKLSMINSALRAVLSDSENL